jgi:hypothetical protein
VVSLPVASVNELRSTFVIRRIDRAAIGVALGLLLAGAVACGGNAASPSPSSGQATSTAALASPSPTASQATSTATPGPPPTLRPGDPAVYAQALDRIQQWLDAWLAGDNNAQNAMLKPESQVASPFAYSQLLIGQITDYQPYQHISDNEFTLLVDLQLHLPTANESAWGEGVNSRFITFQRADAGSPFLMQFATSPPLAAG